MIIDRSDKEQNKRFPETIDGQVLLEEVRTPEGQLLSWITCDVAVAEEMATKTTEELATYGFDRYVDTLNEVREILAEEK